MSGWRRVLTALDKVEQCSTALAETAVALADMNPTQCSGVGFMQGALLHSIEVARKDAVAALREATNELHTQTARELEDPLPRRPLGVPG